MISVCIASYNGGEKLLTQVRSILPQLSETDELIISDDASTDNSLSPVIALGHPALRIVQGPATGSLIDNFENALKHAKGDYIFLSDQDDQWQDQKVAITMRHFASGAHCVLSDCYVTDENFKPIHSSFNTLIRKHEGKFYNLLVRNCYLGCCMAFTRSILERALPFPPNIPMHDIWLGNIAAFTHGICFIDDKLIQFRRHSSNSSSTAHKSPYSLWQKIKFRYNLLFPLIRRLYFSR